MTNKYELVFVGELPVIGYKIPQHRRMHETIESARETARKVWAEMESNCLPFRCHTPLVYGPGCGDCGINVAPW